MNMTSLPPGFRFHPTDPELVKYYLKRKVLGKKLACDVIAEVDIYKHEPWDLPDKSYLPSRDLKWYFFCPREKKYAVGGRLNRATDRGHWKTTGKDRPVLHNAKPVGMIKTLVYHQGRAPKGDRTDWVMHEYRLDEKDLADKGVAQDSFVLCIIFKKEGAGPRNGAQYGAPFQEDDWSDGEDINCTGKALSEYQPTSLASHPTPSHSEVTVVPVSDSMRTAFTSDPGRSEIPPSSRELLPVAENVAEYQPAPFVLLPTQSYSEDTAMPVSGTMCGTSTSHPGQSEMLPPAGETLPVAKDVDFSTLDLSQIIEDGDFFSMEDLLQDGHGSAPTENNDNVNIFDGLEDLQNWIQLDDLKSKL